MLSSAPRPTGILAVFDRAAIAILLLFALSLWYFFEERHRERLDFVRLRRRGSKKGQRVERPWFRRDGIRGLFDPVQDCEDRISECRLLSSNGMCSLSYVKDSCMISCGVCDPSRYDTLNPALAFDTNLCFDVISECDLRSEEVGYCDSMEAELKCKESCGLC